MSNLWKQQGIPHKGWTTVNVYDVREDGQSEDETSYESCMMCGHEKIRFVHVMEHSDQEDGLRVGCVCAEKMSGDYVGPRQREAKLRNRAARRTRWLLRKWRVSAKGNSFMNVDGYNLGVHMNQYKRWGYRIESRFGPKTFATKDEAKLALFDDFWATTEG